VQAQISFVAPTLTTIEGPSRSISGSNLSYPVGDVNTWFLKVSLTTTGQVGIEYPVIVTVSGVESLGREACSAATGCTLDQDLAVITNQLTDLRAEVERNGSRETTEVVEASIRGSQSFLDTANNRLPAAEARLNRAEARMADLCNPDPFCETFPQPAARTPLLGLVVGIGALAAGGYLGFRKISAARAALPA